MHEAKTRKTPVYPPLHTPLDALNDPADDVNANLVHSGGGWGVSALRNLDMQTHTYSRSSGRSEGRGRRRDCVTGSEKEKKKQNGMRGDFGYLDNDRLCFRG